MIINENSRISTIVEGDHGQGGFIFSMKILSIMNSRITVESISSLTYILCTKDNGYMLKNIIIEKLKELFKLILEAMTFDNQQLSISNMYM